MHNERGAGRKPKLTKEQVHSLYAQWLDGKSVAQLSINFDVSVSTVIRIIKRVKDSVLII
jgi:transposase